MYGTIRWNILASTRLGQLFLRAHARTAMAPKAAKARAKAAVAVAPKRPRRFFLLPGASARAARFQPESSRILARVQPESGWSRHHQHHNYHHVHRHIVIILISINNGDWHQCHHPRFHSEYRHFLHPHHFHVVIIGPDVLWLAIAPRLAVEPVAASVRHEMGLARGENVLGMSLGQPVMLRRLGSLVSF